MSSVIRQNAIEVHFKLYADGSRKIEATSPNVALLQGVALAYTEEAFAEFSDEQRAFLRWCMCRIWHSPVFHENVAAMESISFIEAEEIIEEANRLFGSTEVSGSVTLDDTECNNARRVELIGMVDKSWNIVKEDCEVGKAPKAATVAHLEMMLDKAMLLYRDIKDQVEKGLLLDKEA